MSDGLNEFDMEIDEDAIVDDIVKEEPSAEDAKGDTTNDAPPKKTTIKGRTRGSAKRKPRKKTAVKKLGGKKSMRKGATTPPGGGVRKPRRWKPGTVTLREIRKTQKSTELLVPRAPMNRFIRQLLQEVQPSEDPIGRFKAEAVEALQQAAESYLIDMFANVNKIAISQKRQTVLKRDLELLQRVQMQGLVPKRDTFVEVPDKKK